MYQRLCGVTAFRLYRVPPVAMLCLPSFPDLSIKSERHALSQNPWSSAVLGLPFHVLIDTPNRSHGPKSLAPHLWTAALPRESFQEDAESGICRSSPLFTLLTMATHVSVIHLAMAMYEMCGTFAIFRPEAELQRQIDIARSQRIHGLGNWHQVHDAQGQPTSLWQRPPLITTSELREYADAIRGLRGAKTFSAAAHMVSGVTASPFEAQVSLRLGLPRRYGGEGLPGFINNRRIPLSRSARKIAGQSTCYADICYEGASGQASIDIECHGHLIHDGGGKGGLDANRTLALQHMGIEVLFLTYEQISDTERFRIVANRLAKRLGMRRRPKTAALRNREAELCRELFIDWETLGA